MFYFSLALKLGMTVAEMLAKISSYEIEEWKAYFRIIEKEKTHEDLSRKVVSEVEKRRGKG